ncbi:TonB-dependent receptor domain-containing protein [Tenacibaculum amylolyticum]|uniref:TonB-dependent receptor domain-containing protein n=1 Tax=Tenacibaculum amylolyticum TaxID=104269 RepID=UPI0038944465
MLKIRLLLISLFCSTLLISQQEQKKTLKEILTTIEKSFNIKFSFSEEVIEGKVIELNNEKSLSAILARIETKTGLEIKKISNRYYTIAQKPNQTICGYVYDIATGLPLENVTIIADGKGVGTNEKGFFTLKNVNPSEIIKISYVGYTSAEKKVSEINNINCERIYIGETLDLLKEVIISSYLTNGVVKKTDGSITLIPRKQGILPGLTEADVLLSTQQLPGIQSPIENAAGIHIRGGTPDQNLILFDGIKLYNTSHFFGSISAFNPYIVDNVTVYKNASNAKYGNHIAGVIDIKTMSDIPEKTSFGAGFNFTTADVNTTIPIDKKLGIQFSFRRSISDILNTPTFDKLSQKVFQNTIIADGSTLTKEQPFIEDENTFSFIDFNTKLIYQPNKNNTISLQQISIKNNLDYILENKNDIEVRSDEINIENDGFGISWNKKWSETLHQETSGYYSNYTLFYDGNKTRNNTIYDYTIKNNEVKEITVSTQLSQKLNEISTLNFGYQFTHSNISFNLEQENTDLFTNAVNKGNNTNNQQTVLLEYILKKSNTFNLHAGLRSSYMPLLDRTFLEPRIYTRLKLFPSFWINASAEFKQQYTSKIVEFFTSDFGLENELWALSNDKEIPILKSQQYTAGLLFNKNGWIIDAEVYYKVIDGLTSLSTGFNNTTGETIFNGNARILGADVLLKKNWSPKISSWISYTFGDNSLNFSGLNEGKSFKGNFSISNAVYLAQQVSIDNWDFSVGYTIRGGLPFSGLRSSFNEEQQEIQEITNFNINSLPDFHRLDASVTYDFFWDKKRKIRSKVGASFINIYDRKNIIQRSYEKAIDPNDGRQIINTVDTFSLGFTPNIVFRIQF